MDAYYPIYMLLLTLCEAPAGKTVCEKGTMTFQFADALDCWEARANFIDYYDAWPNVIVDRAATRCTVEIVQATETDFETLRKRAEQELKDAKDFVPDP